MNIKITLQSSLLLKHVLIFNGEKEIGSHGKEMPSPRRLNSVESAQRRHFLKKVDEHVEKYNKKIGEINEEFKKLREEKLIELKTNNPRKEGGEGEENEEKAAYQKRMKGMLEENKEVQKAFMELQTIIAEEMQMECEIEMTEKTATVVKKYYEIFGHDVGYAAADDANLENINKAFGIDE